MPERGQLHVWVDVAAYGKMLTYAQTAKDTEVGGLLEVQDLGSRNLYIKDAFLVEQEVSGGSVDFKVGEFERHIKEKGWWGKPMPHLCMGIWHSHVDMEVFMSGTDENDLVQKYACRGWLVNIVVNKKGNMLVQVDSHVGPETGKPGDYVLVTVPSSHGIWYGQHDVKKEFEEKVTRATGRAWSRGEFLGEQEVKAWRESRGWSEAERWERQESTRKKDKKEEKDWVWDPKKSDLVNKEGKTWEEVNGKGGKGKKEKGLWRPATLPSWRDNWGGWE